MCFSSNDYVHRFKSVKDEKHFQWAQSYFPEKKKKQNQKQETAPAAWQDSARMITWSPSALVQATELITDELNTAISTDNCFTYTV